MISGWTIFSPIIKKEIADDIFWKNYIKRNIGKGVAILVTISKDLRCVVCGELSLNYTTKASLARHVQFGHFWRTVEYILENIISIKPDELEEMMEP